MNVVIRTVASETCMLDRFKKLIFYEGLGILTFLANIILVGHMISAESLTYNKEILLEKTL